MRSGVAAMLVARAQAQEAHGPGRGRVKGAKADFYDGRRYASKLEGKVARELDHLKRLGVVREWTPQVRLPIEVPAPPLGTKLAEDDDRAPRKVCHYIADFFVVHADGLEEIIETKGHWTDYATLKLKFFRATWLRAHPDVRFTVRTK